ncbi:MAG: DUF5615 family PIN-like protein, partial [bacterium]
RISNEKGYTASWVRDCLPGSTDSVILDRLRSSGEILVTRDIRFANLVLTLIASDRHLAGVVLIREEKMKTVREIWKRFLTNPTQVNGLIVLTRNRTRIRRLDTTQP